MVVIESKRRKRENILKKYPDAVIADVTSQATDGIFAEPYHVKWIRISIMVNKKQKNVESTMIVFILLQINRLR